MRLIRVLGLFTIAITLAGCGEWSVSPTPDSGEDPGLIPSQPDWEAYTMSMWLSNELEAPSDLYERLLSDLILIREEFQVTVPAVELKFHEPWEPGRLILGFEPEHYQQISVGNYLYWDSLNALYNVVRIDLSMPAFRMLKLEFEDGLNPEVLAEAYRQLPGARFAVPNRYMGERPMLLVAEASDGGMLYFFRNAWGDCPSGCLYSEFWVCTVVDGRAVYDGYYSDKTMMSDNLREPFEAAWVRYWQGEKASNEIAPWRHFANN